MPVQVSSLLRSAQAARTKQLQLNDDLAAYEWANSEQTQEDYQKYRQYLEKRMDATKDGSKLLTLQKKVDSARKGFASNEIQRSAIGVLEGTASLEDKQAVVLSLYKDSLNNGDLNLAQNLRQTFDSIDLQIQRRNEADAKRMAGFAEEMSRKQVTSLEDLAKSYLDSDDPTSYSNKALSMAFKEVGFDKLEKSLAQNGVEYNTWDIVLNNVNRAIEAYTEAANIAAKAGNYSKSDTLFEKAISLSNGDTGIKFGGMSLTANDVRDAADAARNGQNLFQPRKDAQGNNTLVRNKATNYLWARDINGNPRIVTTYNEKANSFDIKQKDANGKDIEGSSVKEKLAKAGYEIMGTDESGLLRIRDTNSTRARGVGNIDPESALGDSYLVSLDDSGNVRYVSERGDGAGQTVYEINLADPNAKDFGASREVDQDAETFFSNQSINSFASKEGVNYINQILAPLQLNSVENDMVVDPTKNIKLYDNANYKTLYGGGVSGIVGGAQIQRADIADRLQAATQATLQAAQAQIQAQPTSLQSSSVANINQSPVPGGARLRVAPVVAAPKVVVTSPTPTPKVNVAPPLPTPKVTGVGVSGGSRVNLKVLQYGSL